MSGMDDFRARVEALAETWNSTPDYTVSEYDQGRVDQRHDMTMQLLELLADTADPRCESMSEDGRRCHGDKGHPGTHWAAASRVWSDTETLVRPVKPSAESDES